MSWLTGTNISKELYDGVPRNLSDHLRPSLEGYPNNSLGWFLRAYLRAYLRRSLRRSLDSLLISVGGVS